MDIPLEKVDIFARSSDGQGYCCMLECEPGKEQEALDGHMMDKGWSSYGYKVESVGKIENDTELN